jgi:plastocyanin
LFVGEGTVFDSNGDGIMPFTFTLNQPVAPGKFVVASASNPESTSEFSQCVEVQGGEPGTSTPTPTPTASASPTPTPTPIGQTPTPTPTGGTATPTPTPTPTPPVSPLHGDVRCDGAVDATDSLGILREVAGLSQISQTEPCPDLSDMVNGHLFGDLLCNGMIDAVDALAVLRFVAGLPPIVGGPGCPVVGEFTSEPQPVSGTVDVTMGDNFFEFNGVQNPTFVMTAGDTVIMNLANQGLAIHNMRTAGADGHYSTQDDHMSDPMIISASSAATIEISFDHPGTYRYRCDFHPADMHGAIVVE